MTPDELAIAYPPLNLPPSQLKVKFSAGCDRPIVFDSIRGKWVALTPEEWVRQHFVAMLTRDKGYVAGHIGNEVAINLNGTLRRCDTVVFGCDKNPLMIVEYKAPSVVVSQKTFDQIIRYNMVLKARYLVVSNGLQHFCAEINYSEKSYKFLDDIPNYSSISKSTQALSSL